MFRHGGSNLVMCTNEASERVETCSIHIQLLTNMNLKVISYLWHANFFLSLRIPHINTTTLTCVAH